MNPPSPYRKATPLSVPITPVFSHHDLRVKQEGEQDHVQ